MRVFALIAFVTANAFGQTTQKDINDQVWKPFIKAFNQGNTEAFMDLHSKDLVRSARDSKKVLNWDQYYKETAAANSRKNNGTLELRFTERINSDNQAIDVGIYKNQSSYGTGYGRFHVILRKENNVWKILVDMDSSEGGTIGETDFAAANSME
jgi:hypothetical protein